MRSHMESLVIETTMVHELFQLEHKTGCTPSQTCRSRAGASSVATMKETQSEVQVKPLKPKTVQLEYNLSVL